MRVITPGQIVEKKYQVTCHKCKAVLEYGKKDIFSQRNEDIVTCPCCKSFIDHNEKNAISENIQQLNG